MTIDKVLAVLDALLQPRDHVLRPTVIIKFLEAVDEVGVLRDMQILAQPALLAHLAVCTVFEGANEGDELFVPWADKFLTHANNLYR